MEIIVDDKEKEIILFPKTIEQEIEQNIKTILTSPKYSVILDRDFGISTKELDTPINIAQPTLIMEIIDAIEKYEPRVEITSIHFQTDKAQTGKLMPIIGVKIKND